MTLLLLGGIVFVVGLAVVVVAISAVVLGARADRVSDDWLNSRVRERRP